jgi:hypothetical protein
MHISPILVREPVYSYLDEESLKGPAHSAGDEATKSGQAVGPTKRARLSPAKTDRVENDDRGHLREIRRVNGGPECAD